jgi:small subunit ribosomal protein S6
MNNYEVLYILDNGISDEAKEAAVAKYENVVTSSGGTVDKTDKWGAKRLAYPINFKNDGYYVLMTFAAAAELPKELERQMRISDEVIRFMVIRR